MPNPEKEETKRVNDQPLNKDMYCKEEGINENLEVKDDGSQSQAQSTIPGKGKRNGKGRKE